MAVLVEIGFGVLLIVAAVAFCYLHKRYKDLRNYTFWVEQSLLQHRPETYIPLWRKQQRKKDVCRKPHSCRMSVQTVITDKSKNPTLN
jgi:hypothetical protein